MSVFVVVIATIVAVVGVVVARKYIAALVAAEAAKLKPILDAALSEHRDTITQYSRDLHSQIQQIQRVQQVRQVVPDRQVPTR